MRQLISFKKAVQWCLILFGAIMLFHAFIIGGIIFFDFAPVEFLWGGRMETKEELLVFEFLSFAVVVLCFFVVLIKSGRISAPRLKKASGVILWILFVLFLLNTVGNIFAKTTFEKSFAIVTIVLAIFCLRLAVERENDKV